MIQILKVVDKLPGGPGTGRTSQWAELAALLPDDGKWAQISPKPRPKLDMLKVLGLEVVQRSGALYARRTPKTTGQADQLCTPKATKAEVPGQILNVGPRPWADLTKRERTDAFIAAWRANGGDAGVVGVVLGITTPAAQDIAKLLRTQGLI